MPAETEETNDAPSGIQSHAPGGQPTPDAAEPDDFEAQRREQLMTAPQADERDAAPRIDVTEVDAHTTRIDVRDDAAYRPGS